LNDYCVHGSSHLSQALQAQWRICPGPLGAGQRDAALHMMCVDA
jgi:hypothetical protein